MAEETSPMLEPLSAHRLARYGMRRSVYDGAARRRFVLFHPSDNPQNELRSEFDTKKERDDFTLRLISESSK